jgi:adenylate kinase family enzyme
MICIMRVAVIGNSGSGKSTLSRQLATLHAMPMLDLDTVAWEPGKIAVAREPAAAARDVQVFCAASPDWVAEGCYAGLVRATFTYSPVLLFLEPGVEACLANCRSRPWEPHKYESKQVQDQHLEFLLTWVREYYSRAGELSLAAHQVLFDEYHGPKHKFTALVDAAELAGLLSSLAARGVSR